MKRNAQKTRKADQRQNRSLDELLYLDVVPEISQAAFTFQKMSLWAAVRYAVVQTLLYREWGHQPFAENSLPSHSFQEKLRYRFLRDYHQPLNLWKRRKAPYVFFGTGIANIRQGDTYYHRLADPLAEKLTGSLLLESSFQGKFARPRHNPNVAYLDGLEHQIHQDCRGARVSSKDESTIEHFLDFLSHATGGRLTHVELSGLRKSLHAVAMSLPVRYERYSRLLDVWDPKLVVVEDASYGGQFALLAWMNERKIATGEYQHGLISRQEPAYNFGFPGKTDFARYLPQYFFSYGKFWEDLRTPSKMVTIGNPWLSMASENKRIARAKKILVPSNGSGHAEWIKTLITLANGTSDAGLAFSFRPHPAEWPGASERYSELVKHGITLDRTPLFDSLREHEYVLGPASTVLFEALAFDRKVILWEDRYSLTHVPAGTFPSVKNTRDAQKVLLSGQVGEFSRADRESVWASHWEKNWEAFIGALP